MSHHLIVIYPNGLGGHHLANMLGNDPQFVSSVENSHYNNFVDHANFGGNVLTAVTTENVDELSSHNRVWSEHMGTYLTLDAKLMSKFQNKSFLVIRMPVQGSIMHQRLLDYNYNATDTALKELSILYDQRMLSRLFNEPFESFFSIDPDLLWCENIAPLVAKIQQDAPIDFDLDIDLLQNVHAKWYNTVVKPYINKS